MQKCTLSTMTIQYVQYRVHFFTTEKCQVLNEIGHTEIESEAGVPFSHITISLFDLVTHRDLGVLGGNFESNFVSYLIT